MSTTNSLEVNIKQSYCSLIQIFLNSLRSTNKDEKIIRPIEYLLEREETDIEPGEMLFIASLLTQLSKPGVDAHMEEIAYWIFLSSRTKTDKTDETLIYIRNEIDKYNECIRGKSTEEMRDSILSLNTE
jgi:hypothetical protein